MGVETARYPGPGRSARASSLKCAPWSVSHYLHSRQRPLTLTLSRRQRGPVYLALPPGEGRGEGLALDALRIGPRGAVVMVRRPRRPSETLPTNTSPWVLIYASSAESCIRKAVA